MTGYRGSLPTIGGGNMDIGEKGISAWKKEMGILNRVARAAIDAGIKDNVKVFACFPTRERNYVGLLVQDSPDFETVDMKIVSRRAWMHAEKLFGKGNPIGIGFFRDEDVLDAEKPAVIFTDPRHWVIRALPRLKHEVADNDTAEKVSRYVDEVLPTDDPAVKVVVTRRRVDDADPEPIFVNDLSLRMARSWLGEHANLLDIAGEEPVKISDPATRARLIGDFPWFDLSGGTDPDEQVRDMAAAAKKTLARLRGAASEDDAPEPGM
ncbi:hypothetical protein ACEUZ9_000749 [Paracoccus litorisediminis]|uniref:hypothetical protein n=1 Tax=Paracoccus litorisediminis TaxID=2006130 RepID=UPI00372FD410